MISLATVKTFLNIADSSHDTVLTSEILLLTSAFNNYCNRDFERKSHTLRVEIDRLESNVFLPNYPVHSVTSFKVDEKDQEFTLFQDGELVSKGSIFMPGVATIIYEAGYNEADLPDILKNVFLTIISQRHKKRINNESFEETDGISKLSIPGVMTVTYDKDNNTTLDSYLDGYQDILDRFKSVSF